MVIDLEDIGGTVQLLSRTTESSRTTAFSKSFYVTKCVISSSTFKTKSKLDFNFKMYVCTNNINI